MLDQAAPMSLACCPPTTYLEDEWAEFGVTAPAARPAKVAKSRSRACRSRTASESSVGRAFQRVLAAYRASNSQSFRVWNRGGSSSGKPARSCRAEGSVTRSSEHGECVNQPLDRFGSAIPDRSQDGPVPTFLRHDEEPFDRWPHEPLGTRHNLVLVSGDQHDADRRLGHLRAGARVPLVIGGRRRIRAPEAASRRGRSARHEALRTSLDCDGSSPTPFSIWEIISSSCERGL